MNLLSYKPFSLCSIMPSILFLLHLLIPHIYSQPPRSSSKPPSPPFLLISPANLFSKFYRIQVPTPTSASAALSSQIRMPSSPAPTSRTPPTPLGFALRHVPLGRWWYDPFSVTLSWTYCLCCMGLGISGGIDSKKGKGERGPSRKRGEFRLLMAADG